jgi:thioredoxin reductase (NADPH)
MTMFKTRTVIIAAGVGAFQPCRLNLKDIEAQEGNSVHYKVSDPQLFAAKDVVVLCGGDSALDWVLELRNIARHVTLIHRSQQFRAAPASVTRLFDLQNRDEIGFLQGNVTGVQCTGQGLQSISVLGPDSVTRRVDLDLLQYTTTSPKLHERLGLNKTVQLGNFK